MACHRRHMGWGDTTGGPQQYNRDTAEVNDDWQLSTRPGEALLSKGAPSLLWESVGICSISCPSWPRWPSHLSERGKASIREGGPMREGPHLYNKVRATWCSGPELSRSEMLITELYLASPSGQTQVASPHRGCAGLPSHSLESVWC